LGCREQRQIPNGRLRYDPPSNDPPSHELLLLLLLLLLLPWYAARASTAIKTCSLISFLTSSSSSMCSNGA
jgi:hypothetical protein